MKGFAYCLRRLCEASLPLPLGHEGSSSFVVAGFLARSPARFWRAPSPAPDFVGLSPPASAGSVLGGASGTAGDDSTPPPLLGLEEGSGLGAIRF